MITTISQLIVVACAIFDMHLPVQFLFLITVSLCVLCKCLHQPAPLCNLCSQTDSANIAIGPPFFSDRLCSKCLQVNKESFFIALSSRGSATISDGIEEQEMVSYIDNLQLPQVLYTLQCSVTT